MPKLPFDPKDLVPNIADTSKPISVYYVNPSGTTKLVGGFIYTQDAGFFGETNFSFASKFSALILGGFLLDDDKKLESFFAYTNVHFAEDDPTKNPTPPPGPPSFKLLGISGGFGVNYRLNFPPIDDMGDFPLLPANAPLVKKKTIIDTDGHTKNLEIPNPFETVTNAYNALVLGKVDPDDSSKDIKPVLEYQKGEYWVGLGFEFSSYKMVKGFILLTVSWGVHTQIDLLGSLEYNFPAEKDSDPDDMVRLAHIEANILASVIPSSGLLSIQASVTDSSYVFAKSIKISGGFAYSYWFSGQHKGDFVLSAGGYHPAYEVPSHYPKVSRLQCKYKLGPLESVGTAYMTYLPHMMMAGLKVSSTWKSGSISAWYDYGADFIMGWTPFHYMASAYVHVGITAKVGFFKVHLSAGVDLELWGPDFGGKAHIDLSVVSFTINFGASQSSSKKPVNWNTFLNTFYQVPELDEQVTASFTSASLTSDDSTDPVERGSESPLFFVANPGTYIPNSLNTADVNQINWLYDPEDFEIITQSIFPAQTAEFNTKPLDNPIPPLNEIDPEQDSWYDGIIYMPYQNQNSVEEVVTKMTITLTKKRESTGNYESFNAVKLTSVVEDVDSATASKNSSSFDKTIKSGSTSDSSIITNGLMGLKIGGLPYIPDVLSSIPLYQLIFQQGNAPKSFSYNNNIEPNTEYSVQSVESESSLDITVNPGSISLKKSNNRVLEVLVDGWVSGNRNPILNQLAADFGTYDSNAVSFTKISSDKALEDWPVVGILGDI